MIFKQTFHRAFHNLANAAALGFCSFFKYRAEVESYRADEIHLMLLIVEVVFDVAAEERAESVEYKLMNLRHIDVFAHEGSERREKTVGLRLAVDTSDNAEQVEVIFVEETGRNVGGELFFQHVAYEQLA